MSSKQKILVILLILLVISGCGSAVERTTKVQQNSDLLILDSIVTNSLYRNSTEVHKIKDKNTGLCFYTIRSSDSVNVTEFIPCY